jgi:predicted ribosome quality control (RQC) complex YloA/Tae2 family protein
VHNNFFFLRQLSKSLDQRLRGFTLVSCFTQNKQELVVEFNDSKKSFFVKASLDSTFCCLSFPEVFHRAKKNSVDLFPRAIMKTVTAVRQYENERAFSIGLEGNIHLLFKMHGNRANVILLEEDNPVELFRNDRKADWGIRGANLDRLIDWSQGYFLANQDSLATSYFTFGKEVWTYIRELGFEGADRETRWRMIQDTLRLLEKPEFMLCEWGGKLRLSLVPLGIIVKKWEDPIQAINEFYYSNTVSDSFSKEKLDGLRQLRTRLQSGDQYIHKNRQKLDELSTNRPYQNWADLIMANLDRIKPGQAVITVENLYDSHHPLEIKLKQDLSPQKNAEVYYRKGKNQHVEIQKLREAIAAKEKELASIRLSIQGIENETELKSLRLRLEESGLSRGPVEKQKGTLPYHIVEYTGWQIWIGKNAESNDKLTLKHAYKEDLWFHAKDVAGSHVLLKYQSGKHFPKKVIERAAELAAYHSKRKNETLCPVTVTPRKFVRKRKGDSFGTVVVEREDVILVTPRA